MNLISGEEQFFIRLYLPLSRTLDYYNYFLLKVGEITPKQ